jgi:predicted nucleic-acid-binding protein
LKAVDTNVLARFLLRDDDEQARLAETVLAKPVWVTTSVWLELGWVMGKQLNLQRQTLADMLEALLELETINTADGAGLRWAVDRLRAGADWADVVHLISASGNAATFCTFDAKLKRQAGSASPVGIEHIV